MREVDEDAETVELPHKGLTEWAVRTRSVVFSSFSLERGRKGAPEPMVQRFDAVEEPARVGEHVVARVGERNVSHPECGELAQCAEGVAELVAPVGVGGHRGDTRRDGPRQTLLCQ